MFGGKQLKFSFFILYDLSPSLYLFPFQSHYLYKQTESISKLWIACAWVELREGHYINVSKHSYVQGNLSKQKVFACIPMFCIYFWCFKWLGNSFISLVLENNTAYRILKRAFWCSCIVLIINIHPPKLLNKVIQSIKIIPLKQKTLNLQWHSVINIRMKSKHISINKQSLVQYFN